MDSGRSAVSMSIINTCQKAKFNSSGIVAMDQMMANKIGTIQSTCRFDNQGTLPGWER
jgi:hypothetical protein